MPLLIMKITFLQNCSCLSKHNQNRNMSFLLPSISSSPTPGFLIWLFCLKKSFCSLCVCCLVGRGVFYVQYRNSATVYLYTYLLPSFEGSQLLMAWMKSFNCRPLHVSSKFRILPQFLVVQMFCINLIYLPPCQNEKSHLQHHFAPS